MNTLSGRKVTGLEERGYMRMSAVICQMNGVIFWRSAIIFENSSFGRWVIFYGFPEN